MTFQASQLDDIHKTQSIAHDEQTQTIARIDIQEIKADYPA
jgi:hypothetical protein